MQWNHSLQTDNYTNTSDLITQFLQARCSSWRPTNKAKALKALKLPGTGEFAIVELRASSVCCMCQRRNTATTRKRLYKQSQNLQIARSQTKVWYLDFAPALPLLSAALRVRTVFCYTLWKSQSDWQRTEINGESTSMVWPTLGSRTAEEQIRYLVHAARPTRRDKMVSLRRIGRCELVRGFLFCPAKRRNRCRCGLRRQTVVGPRNRVLDAGGHLAYTTEWSRGGDVKCKMALATCWVRSP